MQMNDKIKAYDQLSNGQGVVLANSDPHEIIGEVEVLLNSKHGNKTIFTRKIRRNDLLVTGAVFISEKINNLRSSYKTVPIDVETGVHTSDEIDFTSASVPNELICGVMVGNGGCGDTYNTVHKVLRAARSVPGYLPFRVVPLDHDLDISDREHYFLRVVKGEYVYYYGKKFSIDREINVMYEDGTVVPTDVNPETVTKFIRTFTKYSVTVDQRDIREFFKITQGSTMKSLINSIGLVAGYPGEAPDGFEEFFNVRTLTTLNMENTELKDSESTVTFIYRLYFQ